MFSTDPLVSASEAGLRYVKDAGPCIRRVRSGKAFRYLGIDRKPIRDPKQLERIRSLVIPPAWRNVWICPSPNGHLQAVGWDAKGRKQYRYHSAYRATRDQAKFSRMIAFGTILSVIHRRTEEDMNRRGLPQEKVLAAVVRLLEVSFIRVGNEEYAKDNDSFGLTTMRNRHVKVAGSKLTFNFRGKSGMEHAIQLTDRRLAGVVKRCQDLPGHELFQYVDGSGEIRRVDSADVNRYVREISGQDFTAKDFRTWSGTILAARELHAAGACTDPTESKRNIVAAIKNVAKRLGNRPATCRKYYVHPAIIDAYADSSLFKFIEQGEQQDTAYSGLGLRPEEYCAMVVIANYQAEMAKAA